jgi:HK97 gp10 family phage protein
MTRTTFKIEGLSQLNEALNEFSRATSGNILKRAVSAGAALIAEKAEMKAPLRHGKLRREIMVARPKIISPGKAAFAQAMRETGDRAIAAAAARSANKAAGGQGRSVVTQVGPTKAAGQGILQEFGTAHHPAQPWFRPTWDAYGEQAAQEIADVLAREIEKTRARVAAKAAR